MPHGLQRKHAQRMRTARVAAVSPSSSGLSSAAGQPSQRLAPAQAQAGTVGSAQASGGVKPATLPGTPESFPIKEDQLIELAKKLFDSGVGVEDDTLLSDDFRFEFPVISLDKEKYLKAVRGFDLKNAIPDLDPHPYHWRVDPYEPNRVWCTTRVTGTHTGTLKFGSSEYKATGRTVQGAPEAISMVFNEQGKCKCYTGGYVMDRQVGNTNKMGALFGILSAIGAPVPQPGSLSFKVLQTVNNVREYVTGIFSS